VTSSGKGEGSFSFLCQTSENQPTSSGGKGGYLLGREGEKNLAVLFNPVQKKEARTGVADIREKKDLQGGGRRTMKLIPRSGQWTTGKRTS